METIIQKAIEGGYRKDRTTWSECTIDSNGFYATRAGFGDRLASVSNQEIICDSLFWKALFQSKSCFHNGMAYRHEAKCEVGQYVWVHYALRFHELNLTEGFDAAVTWLSHLIKE